MISYFRMFSETRTKTHLGCGLEFGNYPTLRVLSLTGDFVPLSENSLTVMKKTALKGAVLPQRVPWCRGGGKDYDMRPNSWSERCQLSVKSMTEGFFRAS